MAKLFRKNKDGQKAKTNKSRKTEYKGYQSFLLQKKIPVAGKLPSGFRLLGRSFALLKRHAKLFIGMAAIYTALYLVLVQGITALEGLKESKEALEQSLSGAFAGVITGAALFAQLLQSSATLSATANSYQLVVTLVASLALIWTLREVYAGHPVRIRDGYYRGMYPLVPFLLVVCVVTLQLIPMAVGGTLFTTVVNNSIAVTTVEVVLWAAGFLVLALISLYLVTSSLFALYIVCLPDTAPMQALRSARQLVRGRRWQVMRKVLFLPLALVVLSAVIMVPIIMFATPLVGWAFFTLMAVWLLVTHSYMYGLYRSLI